MSYFNFNGKVYSEDEAIVGPGNRGLRYGDGLFETIKMKEGQLIFGDEHFARLWKGMQVLQFDMPKLFTPEVLLKEMYQLAIKNGHEKAARIRLNVFRGNGGLYDVVSHLPNYIIQTWTLADRDPGLNSNGLILGIYKEVKKSYDILSNLKHNNYLPYIMAALHAKKEKWNDAIILNSEGRICDTTIANIFMIKDEIVFTPPLSEACVAGVMRKCIIDKLKIAGFTYSERIITTDELLQADEVFLTNSIFDMRWVQSIGNKEYGNSTTQKIYSTIIPTIY